MSNRFGKLAWDSERPPQPKREMPMAVYEGKPVRVVWRSGNNAVLKTGTGYKTVLLSELELIDGTGVETR